jgi:tetrahydromethanopterin S-methyltransferase subunit F
VRGLGSGAREEDGMNRGLIGTIIGVLVVIILVIVILQLT